MGGPFLRFAMPCLTFWLAACAATPPPPTVTLVGRSCVATPDLSTAYALDLPTDRDAAVTLDETAPCLEGANGPQGVYAMFQLPDSEVEYLLALTSAPLGEGLFSPLVRILDAEGNVTREIARDAFVFRGSSLSLGLRIRPDEEYLLVLSDADTVGESISQIQDSRTVNMVSTGTAFVYFRTGASVTQTYVYSHNGTITISTEFAPE